MNVVKNPEESGESGEPSNNDDECSICQERYIRDNPKHVLICGHSFHESCINKWFKLNLKCPMCRATNLDPDYSKDFNSVIKDLQAQLQQAEQNDLIDSNSIKNGTKLQEYNPLNFKHYKNHRLTPELIEAYTLMMGNEPYHIKLIKKLEDYERIRKERERMESRTPQHNSGAASSSSSYELERQSINSLKTSSDTQPQSKRKKRDIVDTVLEELLNEDPTKDPRKGGTKLKKSRKHKKSKKRRKHKKHNKSRKH